MSKNSYSDLASKAKEIDAQLAPLRRQRHAELRDARDAVEAKLAPLYAELESPDLTRRREVEVRGQIKAVREPMIGIDRELAEITRALRDAKTGKAVTAYV